MTPRACIVTGEYCKSHETMINFHIENLLGGNSVVVCSKHNGVNPYGKTVFARSGVRKGGKWQFRSLRKLIAFRRYSSFRVPVGREREMTVRFLKDQKVDVVLSEFGTQAIGMSPLLHDMGIAHIAHFRGSDASKSLQDPTICEAYRRMMPRVDGVVAVSRFLLDNLDRIGAHHPNAHVIPSGVDTGRFRPAEKTPGSFLAVGRFVEKKRPDITLRAFAAATRDRPQLRLDMVGEGPLLDDCRALARDLGLADRVTFHGALPHDQVIERMARAQVFLQHSKTAPSGDAEGVPTAIQEAMSCGMVVLSTRHAGIPEIVSEGQTGFLVDEGDEQGFAALIARAAGAEFDLAALGARARDHAERELDKALLTARLERVLTDAVDRRRAR